MPPSDTPPPADPAKTAQAAPAAAPQPTLRQRIGRLWVYFGSYRAGWAMAIGATIISALSEPAIPALLKPLLDQGFSQGSLPIWALPVAIVGLFPIRGLAHFGPSASSRAERRSRL